jgi:hypothetical protein
MCGTIHKEAALAKILLASVSHKPFHSHQKRGSGFCSQHEKANQLTS